MFIFSAYRLFFYCSILAVLLVSGCTDSENWKAYPSLASKQTAENKLGSLSHKHCHPGALGPSHIADAHADQFRTDGTRKMAERLKIIDLATNPETNEFISDRRVELLEQSQGAQPTLAGQFQLGLEYLRNGQPDLAIKQFELTREAYNQRPEAFNPNTVEVLYELFGLTYQSIRPSSTSLRVKMSFSVCREAVSRAA